MRYAEVTWHARTNIHGMTYTHNPPLNLRPSASVPPWLKYCAPNPLRSAKTATAWRSCPSCIVSEKFSMRLRIQACSLSESIQRHQSYKSWRSMTNRLVVNSIGTAHWTWAVPSGSFSRGFSTEIIPSRARLLRGAQRFLEGRARKGLV